MNYILPMKDCAQNWYHSGLTTVSSMYIRMNMFVGLHVYLSTFSGLTWQMHGTQGLHHTDLRPLSGQILILYSLSWPRSSDSGNHKGQVGHCGVQPCRLSNRYIMITNHEHTGHNPTEVWIHLQLLISKPGLTKYIERCNVQCAISM